MEDNPKDLLLPFPKLAPPVVASWSGAVPPGRVIEYWRLLCRRRGTVTAMSLAGVSLGVLITLPQTPVYKARTSLEIQDVNQDFMHMKEVSPVTYSQSDGVSVDIQTQIKILQSNTLADRTIAKLRISPPTSVAQEPTSLTSGFLHLFVKKRLADPMTELNKIARTLKVRAAGQTRIIELLTESSNPALAAGFANTLTDQFIQQNMEARWEMSQRLRTGSRASSRTCASN